MMKTRNQFTSLRSISMGLLSLLVLVIALNACSSSQSKGTASSGTVSFSSDVAPIFNNRCIQCHSGAQASGRLDLSSYPAIMSGGKSGAVINPGNASKSILYTMVNSGRMPKKGAKLTSDQVKLIEDWINAGAKDE